MENTASYAAHASATSIFTSTRWNGGKSTSSRPTRPRHKSSPGKRKFLVQQPRRGVPGSPNFVGNPCASQDGLAARRATTLYGCPNSCHLTWAKTGGRSPSTSVSCQGHDFAGCGKAHALYQGTTVP